MSDINTIGNTPETDAENDIFVYDEKSDVRHLLTNELNESNPCENAIRHVLAETYDDEHGVWVVDVNNDLMSFPHYCADFLVCNYQDIGNWTTHPYVIDLFQKWQMLEDAGHREAVWVWRTVAATHGTKATPITPPAEVTLEDFEGYLRQARDHDGWSAGPDSFDFVQAGGDYAIGNYIDVVLPRRP